MSMHMTLTTRFLLFLGVGIAGNLLQPGAVSGQGLIQTMTEQIAKLEIVLQEAKQGYSVVQTGLSTISSIKKGDFDLHSLFFSSLMTVNPAIKGYGKIADIIAMQVQIITLAGQNLSAFTSSAMFNKNDLQYLSTVFSNLEDLTTKDIDELTGIITDGDWQMTDDQRLSKIDALYQQVEQRYNFIHNFSTNVQMEALQRQSAGNSILNLGGLF
jgi:hypothetical protein